jgi:hypothetical protein
MVSVLTSTDVLEMQSLQIGSPLERYPWMKRHQQISSLSAQQCVSPSKSVQVNNPTECMSASEDPSFAPPFLLKFGFNCLMML